MNTHTQQRMQAPQSATQTQTSPSNQAVLHLRPAAETTVSASRARDPADDARPGVRWTTDVVDNEHLNKKKSKICCIFHPQREFGESSDESSGSSSESSDSSDDEANEHEKEGQSPQNAGGGIDHQAHCCGKHKVKKRKNKPATPNAYEKQPQYKNRSTLPPGAI